MTLSLSVIYIYGNYVYNNHYWGIGVSSGINGAYIWSNITAANGRYGIVSFRNDYRPQNVYIINNTCSYNGDLDETDNDRGGIVITNGINVNVKNNLLFWANIAFFHFRPTPENL